MSFVAVMILACGLDAGIGWPDKLYQRIGHPVTWAGRLIGFLEKSTNHGADRRRFRGGAAVTLIVVVIIGGLSWIVQSSLPGDWVGIVIAGLMAWPLVAIRSMHDHVAAVSKHLAAGDIEEARRAVSMIVGRDPALLDEAGIARSALESLAENTSDGIVAPVFWGAIAGLPGIAVYKAVNTMDSMIGHRNARYEHFGKVAARLDDLVNLVPARLTGVLFAVVSGHPIASIRVMVRDAGQHRSPNAGWPEGAMAGALNVRLSGPRIYGDRVAQEPWLNAAAPDPGPADLKRGLRVYRRAMSVMIVVLCLVFLMGF